jgi:hypothetical protein
MPDIHGPSFPRVTDVFEEGRGPLLQKFEGAESSPVGLEKSLQVIGVECPDGGDQFLVITGVGDYAGGSPVGPTGGGRITHLGQRIEKQIKLPIRRRNYLGGTVSSRDGPRDSPQALDRGEGINAMS